MAFSWSTVFGKAAVLVSAVDEIAEISLTDLPAIQADIETEFGSDAEPIAGIYAAVDAMKSDVNGWRSQFVAAFELLLTDKQTVIDEFGLASNSIDDVLSEMINQQAIDSQTFVASECTIGAATPGGSNVGNPTVLTTLVMDGVNPPGDGYRAHLRNAGVESQMADDETFRIQCATDSYIDGVTPGSETFSLGGAYRPGERSDVDGVTSGPGPAITMLNSESLLTNMDFEDFTSDAPDGWTIDGGVSTTHINGDTVEFYRGETSLKLTGDGVVTSIGISQLAELEALTGYFVSVAVKAEAAVSAGQLNILFTGTGYTAASSEKIQIAPASLPTTWTIYSFYIVTPATIPDDFTLTIHWDDTPAAGKDVWIDSLAIGSPVWHGGVGFAVVAGSTPVVQGDRFEVVATSDYAGQFQQFFRRFYGVQVLTSGSPTIADPV